MIRVLNTLQATFGHISTSGLKSDVTIMFIDPDFLYDARISDILPQIRVI